MRTEATIEQIYVYGFSTVDGTLWRVATHCTYGRSVADTLGCGYRAYVQNRNLVDDALRDGKPACAVWDGNHTVFSPVELDLTTCKPIAA